MRCFRRILGVSCRDHRTNISVLQEITEKAGQFESLLETARKRKLQWFNHMTHRHGILAHTIMRGTADDMRGQERARLNWLDDVVRKNSSEMF